MSKLKVTYADGSEGQIYSDDTAEVILEQLFSHVSDDVKARCKVEPAEPAEPVEPVEHKHSKAAKK